MLPMRQLKRRVLSGDVGSKRRWAARVRSCWLCGVLRENDGHLRCHCWHETLLLVETHGQLVQRGQFSSRSTHLLLVSLHVQHGRLQSIASLIRSAIASHQTPIRISGSNNARLWFSNLNSTTTTTTKIKKKCSIQSFDLWNEFHKKMHLFFFLLPLFKINLP